MQGGNASAHGQAGKDKIRFANLLATHDEKSYRGGTKRGQKRTRHDGNVVAHGDRQNHGQHTDALHRPHAEPHGGGCRSSPKKPAVSFRIGDPAGEIESGIGCVDGDTNGEGHQSPIVFNRKNNLSHTALIHRAPLDFINRWRLRGAIPE